MRRKNTIAKTRIDRKLLCLGSLAPLYGGKKNGFFRVGGTIKDDDELNSWLMVAEDRIREKLKDGPVIL